MALPTPQKRPMLGNVLLTIAGLLVILALATLPWLAGPPSDEGLPEIAKFFGRFHPVILHLPIGMFVWVLVQEALILLPGQRDRPSSRTAAGFAAGSAVVAALLGFVLYYSTPDYDKELAGRHLVGGILFACMAVASFVVKVWVDASGGRGSAFYCILLLASAGVMGATSHDGASLTHGKGYLTDHAPEALRGLLGLPERKTSKPASTAGSGPDQIVYTDIIAPILDQKCYACHNAEKQKGKYRTDVYDLLVSGGKEGVAIIPGKSAESNVIVRIELPESDEGHMPPEGKKDIDAHELVLLKWWIDNGASKDAKLADVAATDEVKAALAKITQASEEAAKPQLNLLSESAKAEIERLRGEFPASLNYEYQGANTIVFTALGLRGKFGDKQLAELQPVLPAMVSLDVSHTAITDSGVKQLSNAANLKSLRLAQTTVSDAALETLARLSKLESLNLYGTKVTGPGISKLGALQGLRKLYLWQTQVDEETLKDLRTKLPQCEIVTGA